MSQELIDAAKNVAKKKGLVDSAQAALAATRDLVKTAEKAYYKACEELDSAHRTIRTIAETINDGLSAPYAPDGNVAPRFEHESWKERA